MTNKVISEPQAEPKKLTKEELLEAARSAMRLYKAYKRLEIELEAYMVILKDNLGVKDKIELKGEDVTGSIAHQQGQTYLKWLGTKEEQAKLNLDLINKGLQKYTLGSSFIRFYPKKTL